MDKLGIYIHIPSATKYAIIATLRRLQIILKSTPSITKPCVKKDISELKH